jgi:hypothetical protein
MRFAWPEGEPRTLRAGAVASARGVNDKEIWAQVQANDFPARAQVIADEIAAAKPDLVGLQEATLYRTDVPPDGPATPAETLAYDFSELLVDARAQRGLSYEPVSTFKGTDIELPAGLPPTLEDPQKPCAWNLGTPGVSPQAGCSGSRGRGSPGRSAS